MMAIPLFHVYGMVAGMCFAIASAASMVMIPNPRDMKDVLGQHPEIQSHHLPGRPDHVQRHQQSTRMLPPESTT